MRFLLFITLFVVLTHSAFGQTCNCESNFEWVKKTFEENDAGFQSIIDKKGQAAYDKHNQIVLEKIKNAKTSTECTELLYEWLKFFRLGHIAIEPLISEASAISDAVTYETWKGDISQFTKYIGTKKEADYEGVWETEPYKIGIKKEGVNYIGFIIESGAESWKQGMIKLKIEQTGNKMKSTFYMRNHTPVESDNPELIGKNCLQIGLMVLKRLSPIFPSDESSIDNYIKIIDAQKPYLEALNATTLYLRIPTFNGEEKLAIDSVITANKDKILKTKNLIIDLRNNGGGSDNSFSALLPFLYTNPVQTAGLEYLSTTHNNQRFLDIAATASDEKERQSFKEKYEKLQSRLSEFVNPYDNNMFTYRFDTVYEYPKNIGIIVNKGCASSTEQFLLEAKQSKKVKVFGTNTLGAIDISNMYLAESPCKEFRLHYCLTRRLWLPELTFDDIGLQPDFYLDKSIPKYKWVEFVDGILNQ